MWLKISNDDNMPASDSQLINTENITRIYTDQIHTDDCDNAVYAVLCTTADHSCYTLYQAESGETAEAEVQTVYAKLCRLLDNSNSGHNIIDMTQFYLDASDKIS